MSVGVGFNKTTSKLAVEEAKSTASHIFIIEHDQHLADLLLATVTEDLWNIGIARARRLENVGIITAYHLRTAPVGVVRAALGVIGTRIQAELHGIVAMPLMAVRPPPKQLGSQRAFGQPLRTLKDLQQPVIAYTARLAEKLRAAHMVCKTIGISLATNPFQKQMPQYHRSTTVKLEMPTDDTFVLVAASLWGLQHIWQEGYDYHRAGVLLSELTGADIEQGSLFAPSWASQSRRALWATIDRINRRYGADIIRLAASGINRDWTSKSENRSPYYLTRWPEIPHVLVQ